MSEDSFEVIIIGSGQGGNPLAKAFADSGKKTAVIERRFVGGTCVNYGCTPTKTMVASARVAYLTRRGKDFGVNTGEVDIDLNKVHERKNKVVDIWRSGSLKRLTTTKNLLLIRGEASFKSPTEIQVTLSEGGARTLSAKKIFINTGTRSAIPDIDGLESVGYLNNESIMELTEVPKHLVILGGGYIALEFGQMFRRFGSEVTIIQASERLADHEDPDVSDEIAKFLREDGVTLHLASQAKRFSKKDGLITVEIENKSESLKVSGSHLLVAIGRTPNSDSLKLENAKVVVDEKGFVKCNDKLETNVPNIYVIGDIKGGPQFTHISYDDYRVHETNLIKDGSRSVKGRAVPYCMFTDPELGRIGLSETEAKKAGLKFKVAKMPMENVARAFESDETRGFLKALVDTETDLILGAAILGVDGGEIAAQIQLAMMGGITATELHNGIFSHPARVEALNNLFSDKT